MEETEELYVKEAKDNASTRTSRLILKQNNIQENAHREEWGR